MNPPRHLLVLLDLVPGGFELAPSSAAVLREALALAVRFEARLDVLHSTALDAIEENEHYAIVHESVTEDGRATLRGVSAQMTELKLESETYVVDEAPHEAVARLCEAENIDLVLVGRRDEDARAGLGHVARRVVHTAPAAVWVVQGDVGERPGPETVVVATDLTPVGERALETAGRLARIFDARLHVIHAFQIPMARQMGRDRNEVLAELKAEALKALGSQVEAARISTEAQLHVGCTSPLRAVEESLKRFDADLLVLGTTSRSGLAGILIGNVAEKVLESARCSVLAIKPAEFGNPMRS